MWWRNLLFLGSIVAGIVALSATLFPRDIPPRPHHFNVDRFRAPEFQSVVARVNAAFREQWAEEGLRPAPRASDLTIARRLALGLTGTILSLQEIRQFQ